MPNRKFKVPEVGQLVLAKGTKFLLCSPKDKVTGWRAETVRRPAKVGEALMYLGSEPCSSGPPAFKPRFVYKFLADGIILHTEPTHQKPKQWLSKNVRLCKGKLYK